MGHCWMRTPVSGPLAPYVPGFAGELASRGYSKWTIAKLVRLGAILSRWLEEREREADELSPALLKEYLLAGHKAGWRTRTARAYAPLLGYLHAIGVMAEPEPTDSSQQRSRSWTLIRPTWSGNVGCRPLPR